MDEAINELQLAREDFAAQESARDELFSRLKFLLTSSTLLIAGNLSLMTATPRGWRWFLVGVPSLIAWLLFAFLFLLVWRMYWPATYKVPKTVKEYIAWKASRREQLERVGYASAEKLSERETARIIMEDYATAAAHNRSINLSTQAKMVWANKVVLWITLALIAESLMFVILVGA